MHGCALHHNGRCRRDCKVQRKLQLHAMQCKAHKCTGELCHAGALHKRSDNAPAEAPCHAGVLKQQPPSSLHEQALLRERKREGFLSLIVEAYPCCHLTVRQLQLLNCSIDAEQSIDAASLSEWQPSAWKPRPPIACGALRPKQCCTGSSLACCIAAQVRAALSSEPTYKCIYFAMYVSQGISASVEGMHLAPQADSAADHADRQGVSAPRQQGLSDRRILCPQLVQCAKHMFIPEHRPVWPGPAGLSQAEERCWLSVSVLLLCARC